MTGKRHLQLGIVMGLTSYAVLTGQYNSKEAFICGTACVVGSLFPDIDLPNTKISNCIPVLPVLFNKTFGHRGFIHTPLCMILIDILLYLIIADKTAIFIIFGFDLGFTAHLIQDMFNTKGVMLLYPARSRFKFCKRRCGAFGEGIITFCLSLAWLAAVPSILVLIERLLKLVSL